jgi:hypothetical protein
MNGDTQPKFPGKLYVRLDGDGDEQWLTVLGEKLDPDDIENDSRVGIYQLVQEGRAKVTAEFIGG